MSNHLYGRICLFLERCLIPRHWYRSKHRLLRDTWFYFRIRAWGYEDAQLAKEF